MGACPCLCFFCLGAYAFLNLSLIHILCPEELYDLKLNCSRPLVVEIPDRHGTTRPPDSITKYVREAIGIKI